jgi:hypothetical protein
MNTFVRTPARSIQNSPKSTSASAPGACSCGTIATDASVGLRSDLRATSSDVIPHGGIPDVRVVFVDEPVPDPRRGVALLPRGSQIFPHRIDRVLERPELRRDPIRDLPRRGSADCKARRTVFRPHQIAQQACACRPPRSARPA